jgi:hypothetical protein
LHDAMCVPLVLASRAASKLSVVGFSRARGVAKSVTRVFFRSGENTAKPQPAAVT